MSFKMLSLCEYILFIKNIIIIFIIIFMTVKLFLNDTAVGHKSWVTKNMSHISCKHM